MNALKHAALHERHAFHFEVSLVRLQGVPKGSAFHYIVEWDRPGKRSGGGKTPAVLSVDGVVQFGTVFPLECHLFRRKAKGAGGSPYDAKVLRFSVRQVTPPERPRKVGTAEVDLARLLPSHDIPVNIKAGKPSNLRLVVEVAWNEGGTVGPPVSPTRGLRGGGGVPPRTYSDASSVSSRRSAAASSEVGSLRSRDGPIGAMPSAAEMGRAKEYYQRVFRRFQTFPKGFPERFAIEQRLEECKVLHRRPDAVTEVDRQEIEQCLADIEKELDVLQPRFEDPMDVWIREQQEKTMSRQQQMEDGDEVVPEWEEPSDWHTLGEDLAAPPPRRRSTANATVVQRTVPRRRRRGTGAAIPDEEGGEMQGGVVPDNRMCACDECVVL